MRKVRKFPNFGNIFKSSPKMVKLKYFVRNPFRGDPPAILLAPMIGKEDNEKRNESHMIAELICDLSLLFLVPYEGRDTLVTRTGREARVNLLSEKLPKYHKLRCQLEKYATF
jgi:hypothetical protein